MNINFSFIFQGNIQFGVGTRNKLAEFLKTKSYKKIVLVVDKNLSEIDLIVDFINNLENQFTIIKIWVTEPEPSYNCIEKLRISDSTVDVFVGIGGGSTLDLTKALSVLNTNNKKAIEYRGFNKFITPIKPIIAIPTTAGTGSEITPNASFIDTETKKKMGINGEAIRPIFSILDPELTQSCPKNATISAGLDSIVHGTEAFVAQKSNPMAKLFAKDGVKYVLNYLPSVIEEPDNLEFRSAVMYGAFLSGIALMNSGTGPAAAMSYPLSVHYSVPHGLGGAIFLLFVMEYNINNGYKGYSELLNIEKSNSNIKDNSEFVLKKYQKVWEELKVPKNITQYGYNKRDEELFTNDVLELSAALEQNPINFNKNEIKLLLHKLS